MSNLSRRLRKLEVHYKDGSGLIPHSKAWLDYWTDTFCRFVNGEDVDFTGGTLECLDAVMAIGEPEEKKAANSSGWT